MSASNCASQRKKAASMCVRIAEESTPLRGMGAKVRNCFTGLTVPEAKTMRSGACTSSKPCCGTSNDTTRGKTDEATRM
eukprot:945954-Alexandrium_andersonii.AAC.2